MTDYFDDWEDDYADVITTPKEDGQNPQTLKPDYIQSSTGTKHEYNGLLLVPTAEETERIERERPVDFNQVCEAVATPLVPDFRGNRFARSKSDFKSVKMNYLDAARLRTRGQ